MTPGWHVPTRTMFSCAGIGPWLAERPERRVTLLVDPAVVEAPVTARVCEQVTRAGRVVELVVLNGPGDLPAVTALAGRLSGSVVVGVGGGTVLDQAKLAAVLEAHPGAGGRLAAPQRCGLIVIPQSALRRVALVAVPTTLGTGAELSASACLQHPGGKRLVMGGLRPDVAVVDPIATATLPADLVAEGVLEALARVVGLYVGDHHDRPTEDALAEVIAGRLVVLGHAAAVARRARPAGADDDLRLEIAKLSGLSHSGWLVLGREPYGYRVWYLANELSDALGLRKTTALAALLPVWWHAIVAGDTRLGSSRRLHRIWGRLRAAGPVLLPADPVHGVMELVDGWGVDRTVAVSSAELAAIAARATRAWGGGLPMLGGLAAQEIHDLLARAASDPVRVAC